MTWKNFMPVESEVHIDSTDAFTSICPISSGNSKIHLNARLSEVKKQLNSFGLIVLFNYLPISLVIT